MEVNLNARVSLNEASDLIVAVGNQNTVHLVGEPGIGKTSMFEGIVQRTGFKGVYIDVPNVELGDIGVPVPNHETKTTCFYPNEYWGFHTGEPLVIFLDEFTKGAQAVQNMFHPLLNERRLGGTGLHKESIVITAGNMSGDNVGDSMKAHTVQRVTEVHVAKPIAGISGDGAIAKDSWGEWAIMRGDVAPEVIAWVKEYPQVLASYLDGGQEGNEYIFHPKKPRRSVVSPRTLVKASNIVKQRLKFSNNALKAALEGTIGAPGARDMLAYLDVADSLPTWEQIIKTPETANMPTSPAALCILAFNALQRIDRDNIGKWFVYLKRAPKELQSVFCLTALKSDSKKHMVMTSAPFVTWMRENHYLF